MSIIKAIQDSRVKPIRRTIVLYIDDFTNIPFTDNDIEWMGDVLEDALQKAFNLVVDTIEVRGNQVKR